MLYLKSFCFNPFQQNTYILSDDKGEGFIIDPGNYSESENQVVKNYVNEKQIRLTRLLLTHAHIDHILGNRFIYDTYGLLPEVHEEELFFINRMTHSAQMYGLNCEESPQPIKYIKDGDLIQLGDYTLKCIHTPGHSPGSISFYNEQNKIVISGDALFNGSIGRTDLPMGDYDTLINSIKTQLFALPNDVQVFSGHGPKTTIGHEKETNPFLT